MKDKIKKLIENAVSSLEKEANIEVPEISVEYPKADDFGDYTTNVAMILARVMKKNPAELAEKIVKEMTLPSTPPSRLRDTSPDYRGGGGSLFEKIEVVKPGYINFYLSQEYLQDKVSEINEKKNEFGDSEIGGGTKINNEFISANPTGPLHLGNGRGGFLGDSITRVCRKAGFSVTNEYYVNDAGEQVMKLGHSVLKDEGAVYGGEYIDELNKKLAGEKDVKTVGTQAAGIILEDFIKKTVDEKMQIEFDKWQSEKVLYDEGFVDKAIETLKEKKLTYEKEGALWLKTTEFGDDKDRVLVKGDGQKTYFASDCGYILYKIERGFEKIIEIWGADHHGYVNRFRAAGVALGLEKEQIGFIIVQLVKLVKDGKEVRMSKRAGNVVYIDELIEKVGHDVARFFFLMYSPDTHMNFDLGLAEEKSEKNPVFYVQYAHARICSILRKAEEFGPHPQPLSRLQERGADNADLSLLTHEKEFGLVRELNKFPELVEEVAGSYEVHKLPYYAIKLADKFHSFYNDLLVLDPENPGLSAARLKLINAVRIVLGETLRLIGVDAPEKM